ASSVRHTEARWCGRAGPCRRSWRQDGCVRSARKPGCGLGLAAPFLGRLDRKRLQGRRDISSMGSPDTRGSYLHSSWNIDLSRQERCPVSRTLPPRRSLDNEPSKTHLLRDRNPRKPRARRKPKTKSLHLLTMLMIVPIRKQREPAM